MEQRADITRPPTVDDYFRAERGSPTRHEFRGGRIIAMAGGTEPHARIASNLVREIGNRLKGTPCRAYGSDLRVLSAATGDYAYPDVTVVCGPAEFGRAPDGQRTVANPKLIVEVLSPSTEADDRGVKFDGYRAVPSFEQYVLVAQDRPYALTFLRQPDGTWSMRPYIGLDAVVTLPAVGVELPMADVYADVTFPPPPAGNAV